MPPVTEDKGVKQPSELIEKLRRQRLKVDENAIHFIAGGSHTKADARNSIFKLSQRYKKIADDEGSIKFKQTLGKVSGEDQASGDDEWEPSYKRLPPEYKAISFTDKAKQEERLKDRMIEEMKKIEEQSISMVKDGILTEEKLQDDEETSISAEEEKELIRVASQTDEDEEEQNLGDSSYIEKMQQDFLKQNLGTWFEDIKAAYADGVKLVKVNAFGNKFIRVVTITDLYLKITQANTKSQVKTDREIAIYEIGNVILGKGQPSREFAALERICNKSPETISPNQTLCAVVGLPKGRTLSLIFLEEDRRNAFVFFLRTLISQKKAMINQV